MMARAPFSRQAGFAVCLAMTFTVVQCADTAPASGQGVPLPEESAGIFIGVEKFSHDSSLTDVKFAVNDAVDLAYSLSVERRLMPPNRVLLLLAGEPGEASQARLKELVANQATVQDATQANVYSLVQKQSRLVGEGGVLVLSISTHGYSEGAEQLLLTTDSIRQFRTGVTAEKLLQATQPGEEGLRLLLLDACREQIESLKGGGPDSRSAMRTELVEPFERPGYIVFSAASKGQFAIADDGHGLFTGAILDRLRCGGSGQNEAISLTALADFATREVVRQSRLRQRYQRPELWTGGGSVDLVLPPCSHRRPPPPDPGGGVPLEIAKKIEEAASYSQAGGWDNIDKSFRLYREVFEGLPPEILATLNQGLVARARELKENSPRKESVTTYRELLHPLLVQSRTRPD